VNLTQQEVENLVWEVRKEVRRFSFFLSSLSVSESENSDPTQSTCPQKVLKRQARSILRCPVPHPTGRISNFDVLADGVQFLPAAISKMLQTLFPIKWFFASRL